MRSSFLVIALVLGFANIAKAGFFLSFGSGTSSPSASPSPIVLAANSANELINVYMNYDGSGSTAFQGINLYTSLGDGIGGVAEPVFSGTPAVNTNLAVVFQDGVGGSAFAFDPVTLIVAGSSPYNDGVIIAPQYSNVTATSNSGTVSSNSSVLVAQFKIDTTGFTSGTYAINVNDGILTPATYLNNLGATTAFSAAAVNSSFSITAVPEPSSLGIIGLVGLGLGFYRRRRVL